MDENPYRPPLRMPVAPFPPAWVKRLPTMLTEWLLIAAMIGVLAALLVPAVQAARAARRRCECSSGLKQMANPSAPAGQPASRQVVAPSAPGGNVGPLTRFRLPEALSRLLETVRKKSGGVRWAFDWLVQQPPWFLALVYIVGAGLLAAQAPRRGMPPPGPGYWAVIVWLTDRQNVDDRWARNSGACRSSAFSRPSLGVMDV